MCCFSFLPWKDFSKAKIGEQGKVQEREVVNFPGTSECAERQAEGLKSYK